MSVRLPKKTAAGVLFTLLLMIFGFNVRAADQDPVPRFFYEVEVNSLTEPSDSAADELSVLTPEEESLKAAYEEPSAPDAPDGSVFLGAAEDGGQARFSGQ